MTARSLRFVIPLTLGAGIVIGALTTTVASAAFLGSSIFSDVPAGHFADAAIGDMYSIGVIKGMDAQHFNPNGYLTRAEAAVLMDRLYQKMNGGTVTSSSSSSLSFSSASSVSSLASSSSSSSSVASSGTFSFDASEYSVMENGGTATITVTRSGQTDTQATVSYATSNDGANAADYNDTSGTLTFTPGQTSQTFTVTINDNTNVDGNRRVNLSLSNPSTGASLASNASAAQLVILDDETMQETTGNSVFKFTSSSITATQSQGMAYVTISRSGSTDPVSVTYATSDGSAMSGSDYTSTSGTLNFSAGETAKMIAIPLSTTVASTGKSFTVQISNPTSGTLGDPSGTTVTLD